MRAKVGLIVALLGAFTALLGVAIVVYFGPDGRVISGPHAVQTDGVAIVAVPAALSWSGLQISVLAELPANKPVFVGLGNAIDVADYVDKTRRIEVERFHPPWALRTRTIAGPDNLPSAPTSLDWWLAHGAGVGGASFTTTLPDEAVSLAILSVGSSNLRGLTVTVAYGIRGGFYLGVGLLLLGIGMALMGRLLRRGGAWCGEPADDPIDDEIIEIIEEVVYVYVDEDGVEHEIGEAELADYDLVDSDER